VLTFTGVPGATYIATGRHRAIPYVPDYNNDGYLVPDCSIDYFNFSSFAASESGTPPYDDSYEWYGPGPELMRRARPISIGSTTALGTVFIKPDHLQVVYDHTTPIVGCPFGTSLERRVTYAVVDKLGIMVNQPISILETVYPPSTSTCTGLPSVTHYVCTPQPVVGSFTDILTPSCPQSAQAAANGCGMTAPDQKWEWCDPSQTSPVSIGDIGPLSVFNYDINMGGNDTIFPQGTTFPK